MPGESVHSSRSGARPLKRKHPFRNANMNSEEASLEVRSVNLPSASDHLRTVVELVELVATSVQDRRPGQEVFLSRIPTIGKISNATNEQLKNTTAYYCAASQQPSPIDD